MMRVSSVQPVLAEMNHRFLTGAKSTLELLDLDRVEDLCEQWPWPEAGFNEVAPSYERRRDQWFTREFLLLCD